MAVDKGVKVPTAQEIADFVSNHKIHTVKMGAVDIDGVWRGKRIAADYFVASAYEAGTNICNILFGWDMNDVPMPDLKYTGWQSGYPDFTLKPDLTTLAVVPWEEGVASVICDIVELDGSICEVSPRDLLRKIVKRVNDAGFDPVVAYEFEFYLLDQTRDELPDNGWRGLKPVTKDSHTYSLVRDDATEPLIGQIRRYFAEYGIHIEASNTEHGPGQFEINIKYSDAIRAADSAMLFKHGVKQLAARHGYTATFMAKINPSWAGSSGHVHQSLNTLDGKPAFANPDSPKELSEVGNHYLAGVTTLSPEFAAIYLPMVNSYRRILGGSWAGATATWGRDNRTVAIRSIPSAGRAARVENRIPGADTNPYLVLAATIASGFWGVEQKLPLPKGIIGSAYDLNEKKAVPLPKDLGSAVTLFEKSKAAKDMFGEFFVQHYAAMRRWEVEQERQAVTDWEISRYIETV